LTANYRYTWTLTLESTGGLFIMAARSSDPSPYAAGDSSFNFYWDFVSRTYMSTPAKSFLVQAGTGNVAIGTDSIPAGRVINTGTGAYLSTGGIWTDNSDRNLKTAIEAVDPAEVLNKLVSIPISAWSYKSEGTGVRHIGPMAQDFWAAFGLGLDDRHIGAVDGIGVTVAAIQSLHQMVGARDAEVRALKEQNEALRARLDRLEQKN
ncbi:MAG TPA: tail fiber domain-containing protein, partial [Opitutaceae bacterium]|nr:tail fiber domain-containing protein [Opitutaceae bacterium]